MIWCNIIWYGIIWHNIIWYGMIWHNIIWYGIIWHNIIWYGIIWHNIIWYDMIWYGEKFTTTSNLSWCKKQHLHKNYYQKINNFSLMYFFWKKKHGCLYEELGTHACSSVQMSTLYISTYTLYIALVQQYILLNPNQQFWQITLLIMQPWSSVFS